ncbi:MAG: hypothetical protein A2W34_06460 [Chloroflexi bacterium RBG_16_64_32]|nr:MAG: hypothetical protein A2W34_06460 [Chloroflexi bacterium RBG_16_64_32]
MPTTLRAAAFGLDAATATCAAFNLTYFLCRLARRREETAPRAVALFALALVSLGALGESLFLLASLTVLPASSPPATLPWILVRVLPLAGTAFVAALVLRRWLAAVISEDVRP